MITHIKFENFRGFRSLQLDGLKRVNLIVGHNNSGKTSFLEGLLILCEPSRVDSLPGRLRSSEGDPETRYFRWLLRDKSQDVAGCIEGTIEGIPGKISIERTAERQQRAGAARKLVTTPEAPWHQVHGGQSVSIRRQGDATQRCCIISTQPRPVKDLVALLGKAQRKRDGEDTLTKLLNKVDPRISRIRIDPDPHGNQIIVDVGLSELLPLAQVGQGVQRLVAILAEIIGDAPDVVLIDEVEIGLHHSVHELVWAGLAETAKRLNVQIFATTHSFECVEAAHSAFVKRDDYDFGVIQLFRVDTGLQGRVLDRKHIEAAMDGSIDLR